MYPRLTLVLLPLLILCSALAGVLLGALDMAEALQNSGQVLGDLRLSRVTLALLAGAGLGLAGALTQGVVRNPLASPDLIGVTAGAGLAASSLLLLFPDLPTFWLMPAAIVGAAGALAVILWLMRGHQLDPARLVLVGIALGAWLNAITDWLLVANPQQVNAALVWLTGSLWGRGWQEALLLLPWLLVLVPASLLLALRLDLLALGDEAAEGLGAAVARSRLLALLLAVALAAVSVAVCGAISFVGLMAPHLARLLVGGAHHRMLPATAMIGALLVLLADIAARALFAPIELPAGVLTSLLGAPYFLFLLTRYKGW